MSTPSTYTVSDALALVFGVPPFGQEFTTHHVGKVLAKLLGQELSEEEVLAALRAAEFAQPRPGTGRHLLKWRFTRADGAPTRSTTGRKKRRGPERSIAESMHLKR